MIAITKKYEDRCERPITVLELYKFLGRALESNPNIDKLPVSIASECGYSGAYIAYPPTLAISESKAHLVSDDDGEFNNDNGKYHFVIETTPE